MTHQNLEKNIELRILPAKEELDDYNRAVRLNNWLSSPWSSLYTAGVLIGGAVLGIAIGTGASYLLSEYLKN